MEVVVFGAGSLGSLVGGLLAPDHEVTLVGRDPHVARVREAGLRVTGALEAEVHPAATTDGRDLTGDLVIVTVKSFDTEAAGRDLATGEFEAALSLQNGMGNERWLDGALGATVLAGTATYGARLREPGVVECTGVGEVAVGAREGGPSPVAERVGTAFETAGVETTVAEDMPRRLWEKLAVNAGINAVTALARVENGALLGGSANELARRAARETARVARARGVGLSNREAVGAVERVAGATADNESSMLQDVRAGGRTEVDAINGYVAEAARRADPEEGDLRVPVNETLAELLRAWETGRELR
jgi:2-dehydropantoate 2-reductase